MTIGERIKKRRQELGLTVAQLADKLGKDRTTVYRYESSYIENMPINILEPLANALYTTPSYLMGWDDADIKLPPPQNDILAKTNEKKSPIILQKFNRLSRDGQKKVMQYIDDLIASGNYDDGDEICATVNSTDKKSLA